MPIFIHFYSLFQRRLAKWFTTSILEQEKQRIKLDVHRLVASRDQKSFSNFIEYKEKKIIYKRYYFKQLINTGGLEISDSINKHNDILIYVYIYQPIDTQVFTFHFVLTWTITSSDA